jgi:hypothetical protein
MHVFYSDKDRWMMRAASWLELFKSGARSTPAGLSGFRLPTMCPDPIYARLRTYPWDSRLAWLGNDGGHFGCYQPAFMRAFVIPLLMDCP